VKSDRTYIPRKPLPPHTTIFFVAPEVAILSLNCLLVIHETINKLNAVTSISYRAALGSKDRRTLGWSFRDAIKVRDPRTTP